MRSRNGTPVAQLSCAHGLNAIWPKSCAFSQVIRAPGTWGNSTVREVGIFGFIE